MVPTLEMVTLENFDAERYLLANADVAAALPKAGFTAYDHFLLYGMKEKRSQVAFVETQSQVGSRHGPVTTR
jgi:hypothetical protein